MSDGIVDHSLTCIWSIACRRCYNYMYIFILDLTPAFHELGKDNRTTGHI